MSSSSPSRRLVAVVALWASAAACAAPSAFSARLAESAPLVRRHEQLRDELAARDDPGGGLVRKGGCPVCQW